MKMPRFLEHKIVARRTGSAASFTDPESYRKQVHIADIQEVRAFCDSAWIKVNPIIFQGWLIVDDDRSLDLLSQRGWI